MDNIAKPRNLLKLTGEEKRQFLNSFDHVFCDIDGVIWNVTHSIEGCDSGVKALREAGKHLTFITNNSVRPEEHCMRKLKKHKIDVESKDLMHPAKCIVEYLNDIKFTGLIYSIASESFNTTLRTAGFQVLEGPNEIIEESVEDLLAKTLRPDEVKAVTVDFDFNLTFMKMMRANFYLRRPDCLLLGGATDYLLPLNKHLSMLGPGGFVKILEKSSHRELLLFGKPGKALANFLIKRCNITSCNRVLMIGDMLEQDVRFARECGFQSLLVLSGGTSFNEMMAQTDINLIPGYYTNSITDFVEFFQDINKSHA